MSNLDLADVCEFVNENIVDFHERRINSLESLNLNKLLRKNPYLFKAKNISTANELITGLLNAFLSSSEEKLFGDFLEELAIFIAGKTYNGHKSSATGVDLEFFKDEVHYIVSIKSGTNWGNSSQHKKLEQDLANAVKRIQQSHHSLNVRAALGICYGNTRTSILHGYLKVVGQNFWYLISDNKELYKEIIEPIGYRAKEHNDVFFIEKNRVVNRFSKAFLEEYCFENGDINWDRLVEFNSGNFDLS
ncbi:MAG: PmeII family type II restriction endonuclease [Chloroflexota bacterium]|nr:PmeII family type II restriction endonuclease [Chloroflexota bacterium]